MAKENKSHGPRGRAGARVGRGRRAGGLGQKPVVQRGRGRAALHAVAVGDGARRTCFAAGLASGVFSVVAIAGAASTQTAAKKGTSHGKRRRMKMKGGRNTKCCQRSRRCKKRNKNKKESKKAGVVRAKKTSCKRSAKEMRRARGGGKEEPARDEKYSR